MNHFRKGLVLVAVLMTYASIAVAEHPTEHPKEHPADHPTTKSVPLTVVEAEKTLYERLGGQAAIQAVVDDFVPRAAANPAVNFTRAGHAKPWEATPENVDKLKKHLADFIGTATGGSSNYQGRDIKTAHEGMKITSAEFDAIAGDLLASLKALKVPEKETNELMAIAASTKGAIVEVTEVAAV